MTAYDDSNIFARMMRGEIPAIKVHEDDAAMVIMDIMPESKGHCLIIPKAPSRNILDASDETLAVTIPIVAKIARAAKKAFNADGVQVIQFNEGAAGQTVYHLHFHVIPVYDGVARKKHAAGEVDQETLKSHAAAIKGALA
ncbi:Histidine triad (HIT) protein [Fulvimarina pelagi HTCC2506]|uniref:Histidine triad (HIT) protein n=1 Tax=Fulvimarina pelagi HTCC2506 TaxID=314231 RepID=Q0G6C7_9HYPH|nr:HIT domain-containing protein [Fulvimarina pelagi]EAU42787.1 Histidine triad (HIT) protein [Fulvimarina pelagi HTCC2506]